MPAVVIFNFFTYYFLDFSFLFLIISMETSLVSEPGFQKHPIH
ncbi:hypothetical protein ASZ90_006888 [hydrocarbon metagenome]|uniref:Uncharacterized protein n=1 Tax=hydrocarbon metagenome TaxID=938273 RepID=A0A0W8FR37_9ZZZZ